MRRKLYCYVTGPKFALHRLCFWAVQIPPAVALSWLNQSVKYLVFLSLAALIESALTDMIEGWKYTSE